MKFKYILPLFVLILLAGSVWAVEKTVPSPGDAFDSIVTFFSTITVPSNTNFYYFLVFLLYLIILVAIFAELVKRLPLFGASGELSTAGKWFVGAAAGLATLGIFLAQQVTGKNALEMLTSLVAPFGVWGGVAIGGIVAYISYEGLRSFPFFEKHKIIVTALAFAIGMMLVGILAGWPSLLSWGYLIMGAAILVAAAENWVRSKKDDDRAGGGEGGGAGTPAVNAEEDKAGEKEEKLKKFTMAEYKWLKDLTEEVEKEHKEKDGKLEDVSSFKYINPRREERTTRRMRSRIESFIKLLEDLEKKEPAKKAKFQAGLEGIEVNYGTLVKLVAKGGEFDKVLGKKVDAGFTKDQKYSQLKEILAKAAKADQAFYTLLNKIEENFKHHFA